MSGSINRELNPPARLLLGPGPSNVDSRVLKAMTSPVVGHLDPYFLEVMDDTMELLRYAFRTKNEFTVPISGTGSAGMEASLCNVVEPGDEVIIGVSGFFGDRMAEVASRYAGKVIRVEQEWGKTIGREQVETALKSSKASVVAIVHAETSTGVLQPLDEISEIAHQYGALLVADAVTSLGGCELDNDDLRLDVCYSCSQKCLSCPPGLAPITFSDKAVEKVLNRKTKVQSWYFDVSLLGKYWSEGRIYHHTAPISMIYGLREALRIVHEEGIESSWERHRRNSEAFIAGVEAMGFKMHAEKQHRLPSLNAVAIPPGVSDRSVRGTLLNDFNIEFGGGLGALSGKLWRVGLMGVNSAEKTVILALEALERALRKEGHKVPAGGGVSAAIAFFSQ